MALSLAEILPARKAPKTASEPAAEPRAAEEIVDAEALAGRLRAIAGEDLPAAEIRARLLEAAKTALAEGRAEIRRRFEAGASGLQVAHANCFLVDQIIGALHHSVTEHLHPLGNPSAAERLALIALGGYGRGELAPSSDIDLLFLLPYKMTPRTEQVIEELLYLLWDLGLKVGHSARSLDDCVRLSKTDMMICTSLLERRLLCGDAALAEELAQRFEREVLSRGKAKFIDAKLAERDVRHRRQGTSRYTLEPNIKDGKGGLRDLHTLFWIAKYIYRVYDPAKLVEHGVFTRRELRRLEKAHAFLWTLRCNLHYLTGRGEERLTFDLQKRIAPRMGYTAHVGTQDVERFMKHYFLVAKDIGDLTRIFCAVLEVQHNRAARFSLNPFRNRRRIGGFRVEHGRLSVGDPKVFAEKPIEMLRIFRVAQEHDLDIHPEALRAITRNLKRIDRKLRDDPEANRLFLEMLTSEKDPETTLRRMNEAGVFGRFVPDFGRVVAQMQYNMYHHFTVDEHTIFAIGELHRIETGAIKDEVPIASEVVHKVLSRRVLYLALLLHDIAKGRGGDHSEVGAEIAHSLGPRLGYSEEEVETVAWLVRQHLVMSHTAFTRDMEDPQTIETFAEVVQSMERLRLLLVLTVADIRAVGPGTWTAWKAALLRDLYWRSEEVLSGGLATEGRGARIEHAKQTLASELPDWSKAELKAHMARGTPSYWLSLDQPTLLRHAKLVRQAERDKAPLAVDTRADRYRGVTEVTIYTADSPGLFGRIAGAIAVAGGSIEGARIATLANDKALDTFYVRDADGGPIDSPTKRARLTATIEKTLNGRLDLEEELQRRKSTIPSRLSVFRVPPRVLIDNKASATHTVVEVNGRDRPGLLYHLAQAISGLKLTIHSAKISTFGERAVDVFYLADAKGRIENKAKLAKVRAALVGVLEGSEVKAPARTAAKDKRAPAARPRRAKSGASA